MKRDNISKILSGIDPAFVEECVTRPSERNTMKHSKRLAVLIAAACLLVALGITAYAAARSILGDFWGSYGEHLQDPQEQRALGREDYADWLEGEHKMVDKMLDIAGKTTAQNTFVPIQPGSKAGIAQHRCAVGGQIDIDLNDPAYADLDELQPRTDLEEFMQYGAGHQVSQEELQEIALRLKRDGKVTFVTYDSWLSDHVYANGEDLGPCHGDIDENGNFTVDPMIMGIGEVELPESCRNLPEITVTLNYCVQPVLYVLEGDSMSCATAPIQRYPVNITIQNNTQP